MGSLSLLQGIFPTQGSNPGLPHCRWILYLLSHQGSPWVVIGPTQIWEPSGEATFLPNLILWAGDFQPIWSISSSEREAISGGTFLCRLTFGDLTLFGVLKTSLFLWFLERGCDLLPQHTEPHLHIDTRKCICTQKHNGICTHKHTCTHTDTHAHTKHTCIDICAHTNSTCTHIDTFTHIDTRS